MPTILRIGRYRFFFYSNEGHEPPHIHVVAGGSQAKYWLDPIDLAWSIGFNQRELTQIRDLVVEHQNMMRNEWARYFGGSMDD